MLRPVKMWRFTCDQCKLNDFGYEWDEIIHMPAGWLRLQSDKKQLDPTDYCGECVRVLRVRHKFAVMSGQIQTLHQFPVEDA